MISPQSFLHSRWKLKILCITIIWKQQKMLDITGTFILLISVLAIILFKLWTKSPKRPYLGIYQKPDQGFWLKVSIFLIILYIRKIKFNFKKYISKSYIQQYSDYEKPQKLSFHEQAIDAVYFNGSSINGDKLITNIARRKNDLSDGFFYLKIEKSGLGLLESPKLPDTSLYVRTENKEGFAAEGIRLEPIEPMKKWNIFYKGKMKRHGNENEMFDVEVDAVWHSDLPFFDFDTDIDELSMAKAVALEKWSKEYFETLREVHQTHYEQFGTITGQVKINGTTYKLNNINSVRDHSFGNHRNWRYFHRYSLHWFTTEIGDHFMVGTICMPIAFSILNLGYVYCSKDKKIYPVKDLDFLLYQHGENGDPPLDYAFSFTAGKTRYSVQVNVKESPFFYISKDWESKVIERLCEFRVNGKKGWGAAEFQYYNIKGRKV